MDAFVQLVFTVTTEWERALPASVPPEAESAGSLAGPAALDHETAG